MSLTGRRLEIHLTGLTVHDRIGGWLTEKRSRYREILYAVEVTMIVVSHGADGVPSRRTYAPVSDLDVVVVLTLLVVAGRQEFLAKSVLVTKDVGRTGPMLAGGWQSHYRTHVWIVEKTGHGEYLL